MTLHNGLGKRAVLYSRVSTDAQERDGTSLDTQEQACQAFALDKGWVVVASIKDTASGFNVDRPGIARVRDMLRRGETDIVLSYAVDRLSRNQNHIGVLISEAEQAGVTLDFVMEKFEDTAIGRFILAARAFIAEVEREKIFERTIRGKIVRARSGKLPQATGKGIYGYIYNRETGQREVVEEQAAIVRRLFVEFANGASLMGLANRLNAEGVRTFMGKLWTPATVFRLLKNETYTGHTVHRRTRVVMVRDGRTGRKHRQIKEREKADWIEVPNATPAIVDAVTFGLVKRRLNDPERLKRGQRQFPYPLTGRLRCIKCGRAMVGQTLRHRYRYYRCRSAFAGPKCDRCDSLYVRCEALEQTVRTMAAEVLTKPAIVFAEWQRVSSKNICAPERAQIQRQVEQLNEEHTRLVRLFQIGQIGEEYLVRESQRLKDRKVALNNRLEVLGPPSKQTELPALEALTEACHAVRAWIDQAEGDKLTLLAEALQLEISASREGGFLRGVIPEYAGNCNDAHVCSFERGRFPAGSNS